MKLPRTVWVLLAIVLYPLMFALGAIVLVLPPINIMILPIWFALAAGLVGRISNGIAGEKVDGERSPLPERARRPAGPANERLVEGALVGEA